MNKDYIPEDQRPVEQFLTWRRIIALGLGTAAFGAATGSAGRVYADDHWRTQDTQLNHVVEENISKYLSRDTTIVCGDLRSTLWSSQPLSGYVNYYRIPFVDATIRTSKTIHLDNAICDQISAITPGAMTNIQVNALLTAQHEIAHTDGVADEAKATCEALQNTAYNLYRYGYPPKSLIELKPSVNNLVNGKPSEYRSSECRVNGPWDDTPGKDSISDVWLPNPGEAS